MEVTASAKRAGLGTTAPTAQPTRPGKQASSMCGALLSHAMLCLLGHCALPAAPVSWRPSFFAVHASHRSAISPPAGWEEKERPWLKPHVHTPAARDPEPGATRKRPLIYVYELPAFYNAVMLQVGWQLRAGCALWQLPPSRVCCEGHIC